MELTFITRSDFVHVTRVVRRPQVGHATGIRVGGINLRMGRAELALQSQRGSKVAPGGGWAGAQVLSWEEGQVNDRWEHDPHHTTSDALEVVQVRKKGASQGLDGVFQGWCQPARDRRLVCPRRKPTPRGAHKQVLEGEGAWTTPTRSRRGG